MEAASSFCHTTPHGILKVPKPWQAHLPLPRGFGGLNMKGKQRSGGAAAKCSGWDTGFLRELEREGGEEWKRVEKCKERKGMVELLECLEREAILGDDHGRDPTDYNRRALIFHHSSRVFQALKQSQQS
ncbi:hypothetical protein like AT5G05220 [Hibiscus trionum]|uniref:Uncharacterized protein n=1 Tax=Hibiscus trionum TaxID=183268 RepID=A0A9W7HQR4_HIBTR|nr:hypothetical protein like AT5G05220 [Hibiscus trionum]